MHCCVCSVVCHHINGPWYCEQHDPRPRVVIILDGGRHLAPPIRERIITGTNTVTLR